MAQRYDNYYRPRSKGRRSDPQGDAIVVALTLQIIVCIILLLAAIIAKKMNEDSYVEFKQQYEIISTDQSQNGKLFNIIENWTAGADGFFATIEKSLNQIISSITGTPQSTPEVDTSQPDELAQGDAPVQQFSYGYLDDLSKDTKEGMGGSYPVSVDLSQPLTAPAGSSLAPVALAGVIKPPVTGRVTSKYAYRFHPITETTDFHTGIDIAAAEGSSVLAALPGEVDEVGESSVYGNYIIIRHSMNTQTFYAHCSEIIAAEGMAVRQGERIAKVGQTGVATGPHLHFSVIVDDTFTDPLWVLEDNIKVIE